MYNNDIIMVCVTYLKFKMIAVSLEYK